ncbi:ketimine reductase mu-crystallin-like isoform X1 [Dermacentor albipictus]|uniref:ketimine reductase mu-crystallin-like isoform X1 n=1 Tax=Dermacentor albipictus TaxID=60249 RepID=UPI0031FC19EC
MFPFHYYTASQVKQCLESNILELVDTLEQGFRNMSLGPFGGVVQPGRNVVPVRDRNGILVSMSAYSAAGDALATRVVTFYPDNPTSALPIVQGVVLLFHAGTGSVKCVMDAKEITAYRTAAASAVATKYLANEKPKILAVMGAGTQAKSHIVVLSKVFKFDEIRVWNHREHSAMSLVHGLAECGLKLQYVSSPRDAVHNADVVVTATASPTPILQSEWLKTGVHVNVSDKSDIAPLPASSPLRAAVGAPRPDWQELSEELMRKAVVYVDSSDWARTESGDIVLSGAEIFGEIGDVVLGTKENKRAETTVFKSLGVAIEDVLTADLVYRRLAGPSRN